MRKGPGFLSVWNFPTAEGTTKWLCVTDSVSGALGLRWVNKHPMPIKSETVSSHTLTWLSSHWSDTGRIAGIYEAEPFPFVIQGRIEQYYFLRLSRVKAVGKKQKPMWWRPTLSAVMCFCMGNHTQGFTIWSSETRCFLLYAQIKVLPTHYNNHYSPS